jgi:cyclophilin family peptidyl-prolyl cis-trans isomerase
MSQAGARTDSVYGGVFMDDPLGLQLSHNRPGLLSMANTGRHTNGAEFSIMMAPAQERDGKHVIFGELVSGWDIAEQINALGSGIKNQAGEETGAVIVNSGLIRHNFLYNHIHYDQ